MPFYKLLFLLLGCWLISQPAFTQRLKKTKALPPKETEGYMSVGVQLQAMNYFGDVISTPLHTRPGLTVFVSRKISPKLHARLNLSWGRIQGDDFSATATTGVYARNLHFRNDLKELGGLLMYELKGSYGKHGKRADFSPYLIAGIALLHHNPQAKTPTEIANKWIDLQPLGTEGQGRPGYAQPYSKIQLVIPAGIGLRWKTDKRWDFAIEVVPRYAFTDYLDDVSGEYPDMADLGNPLAVSLSNRSVETVSALTRKEREMETILANFPIERYTGFDGNTYTTLSSFKRGESTRGNPKTKDFYIVTGFHLSYIMNVGLKCPQFR